MRDKYKLVGPIYDWLSAFYSGKSIHRCKVAMLDKLRPGDIISTGTPPGVGLGQKPPVYLRAGQTMRLGIDGLGEQRQRTVQA